jgi:hypothetical protein
MAESRRLVEGAEEVTEHDQEGIVSTGGEGRGLLPGRRVGPRRVAVCGRDLAPGLRHRTKNLSWRAAISDESACFRARGRSEDREHSQQSVDFEAVLGTDRKDWGSNVALSRNGPRHTWWSYWSRRLIFIGGTDITTR